MCYFVMLECVNNKYIELQVHLTGQRLLSVCRKPAVRVTGLIMQPLVDILKWFGVKASGWSVSVCLFLLFFSLLYWWVKRFHHEVSNCNTNAVIYRLQWLISHDQWFLIAWWEVTTVRSKQLRLVFLRRWMARSDQIPITHVSALIF